jgi:chemosensory pili system protein ChpA (sensor histidine kinase/response regulator)
MASPLDRSGIIEFFLVEAGDHLQNLNKGLLSLERDPSDTGMIDELFRAAHTLKGSAAMMGFLGVSDVAHKAEDMLGMLRSGSLPIRKETLNFLFDSVDAVKLLVDGVAANRPEDPLVVETITRAYKAVVASVQKTSPGGMPRDDERRGFSPEKTSPGAGQEQNDDLDPTWERVLEIARKGTRSAQTSAPASPIPDAADIPPPALPLTREIEEAGQVCILEKRGAGRRAVDAVDPEKQSIRVNIDCLDNLMNLVGEMVVGRNHLARQVDLIKSLRDELASSQKRLIHEIRRFEDKYEYTLTASPPDRRQETVGLPVDFPNLELGRYDDFNLLSRKLTEITNDMTEITAELAGFFDTFELDTARISTITTNLQDEITKARMVEMDKLYQMFQRLVRDLAQEENKQVNMVVSGGNTRIDKTVFEIISDPLMHMIRNAVSHGLETASERTALGKEPMGALTLNARHEGNSIILQIEDDGRGMDPEVLRKTAADKGFLSEAEARSLTDQEAVNLIFRPGFSTAETVGRISGRGVGMDVVSTHLARINGRIEIKTGKGAGTRFVIRIPLTLTIAQALIVKLKDREMAVPMNLVEETTRFSYKDIQMTAGEEMVSLRGELIRLLTLNELLGVSAFPKRDAAFRHPTLILGMAGKRIALMVEDITGREEIVVKSLGEYLRGVRLFSGATISGEGNVRLIVNVASLFEDEPAAARAFAGEAKETRATDAAERKPMVLVVDDSISIRKFAQAFLDRAGYETQAAPGGMEALELMNRMKFDAVIVDLEMPVMHGYDLLAEMKKSPDLMNIPVLVLTSEGGDKHRKKALGMGARDYLVKPFEEQEMLGALKKLLSGAALAGRA